MSTAQTGRARNNGSRGAAFERLTMQILRDDGWVVGRSAGSRGSFDICALKAGEQPLFIQVKSGGKYPLDGFSPADREALLLDASRGGARPILVRWFAGQREALWLEAHEWKGNKRGQPDYIVDPETECWLWQKADNGYGYGAMTRDGRTHAAHRWYYQQAKGAIPEGLHLDHLCGVRRCVNPDHLEPVTMTENLRRAGMRRLTEGERKAIRKSGSPPHELAAQYGVGVGHIWRLRKAST